MCWNTGLNEQGRLGRIHASSQPVNHHIPNVLLDHFRRIVMSSERMPIGNEKQALELMLQFHPVLEHTMVMPQMQTPGGTHPRSEERRGGKECSVGWQMC